MRQLHGRPTIAQPWHRASANAQGGRLEINLQAIGEDLSAPRGLEALVVNPGADLTRPPGIRPTLTDHQIKDRNSALA
jgi:hypothetical protein